MRLHAYFLLTHFGVALVAVGVIAATMAVGDASIFLAGAALAMLVAACAATFASRRMQRALGSLESVIADCQTADQLQTGWQEFDQLAQKLAKSGLHWETIAAATRDQLSEFQAMMTLLDRRVQGQPSSQQLKGALIGLGQTIHSHLTQIERGAAEIDQFSKSITEGADSQGHAVIKTTSYVEQLSTTIDTVSNNAAAAQAALGQTVQSAAAAAKIVHELNQGMRRVQSETESCEKKLKGLCDPTRQISAIVESISAIAARTNLLALNASIESIRAGEHGRGFALVADEVRNLAEQATDATREISSLLDSMQMATQESIRGMVREREQVETEVQRAADAEQTLRQITELGNDTRAIEQIAESSAQQLQLAQEVVLAVEQISRLAKANRGCAESIGWTMKTLTNINPQLGKIIDRLQQQGNRETPRDDSLASPTVVLPSTAPAADFVPVA